MKGHAYPILNLPVAKYVDATAAVLMFEAPRLQLILMSPDGESVVSNLHLEGKIRVRLHLEDGDRDRLAKDMES